MFTHRPIFEAILILALWTAPCRAIDPDNTGITPVVRDHYINVKAYPDYSRRPWPMPSWETFENRVQLVGHRYINSERIRAINEASVFRPNYDFVTHPKQADFTRLANDLKTAKPRAYVWNLGGYIPDYASGGFINRSYIEQLKSSLGEQFLGCASANRMAAIFRAKPQCTG